MQMEINWRLNLNNSPKFAKSSLFVLILWSIILCSCWWQIERLQTSLNLLCPFLSIFSFPLFLHLLLKLTSFCFSFRSFLRKNLGLLTLYVNLDLFLFRSLFVRWCLRGGLWNRFCLLHLSFHLLESFNLALLVRVHMFLVHCSVHFNFLIVWVCGESLRALNLMHRLLCHGSISLHHYLFEKHEVVDGDNLGQQFFVNFWFCLCASLHKSALSYA